MGSSPQASHSQTEIQQQTSDAPIPSFTIGTPLPIENPTATTTTSIPAVGGSLARGPVLLIVLALGAVIFRNAVRHHH